MKRILIHPDIFYSKHSGAIAAREASRQLTKLNYEVGVFTHDRENKAIADYKYYKRIPYTGTANYFSTKYKKSFNKMLNDFKPHYVFFIGGIVDTPLAYLDICFKRKIKTVFLFLVQDFYCARLHAGLNYSSCSLCLNKSNIHSFINNCGEKQRKPFLYLLNYQIIKFLSLKRIKKIDYVLGSSDQQLGFYKKVGVKENNIIKIPLFFEQVRVKKIKKNSNSYFVILGQSRHEKGMHLISKIIDYINKDIIIKLLFFNDEEADYFINKYPENMRFITSGQLKLYPNVTMTNGAIDLIAGSKGVINPTIWATTTEFVLLEVLGLSKPVIVFDVGIHKEIIKNRVNGICVKTGDFKAMGDEINFLNKNKELELKISKNAILLFHQLTDESSFNKILKNIFQ